MIRFTRLRHLARSSGTGTRQHGSLHVYLCRIPFTATRAMGTLTSPISRLPSQKPPKWMPNPTSRTFSLKNWPYGDGPV
jgi:hypothetical protein